jgi:hypothetical protein
VENLTVAGLQAILHLDLANEDKRGRPQERLQTVQNVRACLARCWRNYERGTYKLNDAIGAVAKQKILHTKRIAAAWQNKDLDLIACQRRRNIGAPGGVKLRQPVAVA